MATRNSGSAATAVQTPTSAWSQCPPRQAATRPNAAPLVAAITTAVSTSDSVHGIRSPINCDTGAARLIDQPRSPRARSTT